MTFMSFRHMYLLVLCVIQLNLASAWYCGGRSGGPDPDYIGNKYTPVNPPQFSYQYKFGQNYEYEVSYYMDHTRCNISVGVDYAIFASSKTYWNGSVSSLEQMYRDGLCVQASDESSCQVNTWFSFYMKGRPEPYYITFFATTWNDDAYDYILVEHAVYPQYTPPYVYVLAIGLPLTIWVGGALVSWWLAYRRNKHEELIAESLRKSPWDLFLLWLPPAGIIGLHHFYLKRPAFGVFYLFTLGGLGIGWLVDLWRLPWLYYDINTGRQPLPSGTWLNTNFDTYMMWFPFGILGLHHFYLRRPLFGALYMVSFGLFGLGWLADLFRIPSLVRDANRRAAERNLLYHEHTPLSTGTGYVPYQYTQPQPYAVPTQGGWASAPYQPPGPSAGPSAPPPGASVQSTGPFGSGYGGGADGDNTTTGSVAGQSSTNGRELCCICMNNAVNTVILECHHSVLCLDCAKSLMDSKIKECPVCRQEIKEIMEIYR